MAGFKRSSLEEIGLTQDQIEKVMTLHGTSMSDYVLKSDAKKAQDEAVKTAVQDAAKTVKIEESEQYKKLATENAKIKTLHSEVFADVKKNYKEIVFDLLDHSEGHKDYKEQLPEVKEKYAEMFTADKPADPAPAKPQFGAPAQGSAPKGEKNSFGDFWGFAKKT